MSVRITDGLGQAMERAEWYNDQTMTEVHLCDANVRIVLATPQMHTCQPPHRDRAHNQGRSQKWELRATPPSLFPKALFLSSLFSSLLPLPSFSLIIPFPSPFSSKTLKSRWSRERCELPQRDLGQSPSQNQDFRGPTLKERKKRGDGAGREKRGKGENGKKRAKEKRGQGKREMKPQIKISGYATVWAH